MDRPHLRASCKCGANQFVVDLPTFDDVHLLNCHCRACRRHAAAPWATYLYKDFVEQKLNPARGGRVGAGGSTTSHYVGLQWGQSVFYTAGDLHKEKFVKKVPFFPCSGLLEDSNKELQAARKWVCAVCHSSLGLEIDGRGFFLSAGILEDGDYSEPHKGRVDNPTLWPARIAVGRQNVDADGKPLLEDVEAANKNTIVDVGREEKACWYGQTKESLIESRKDEFLQAQMAAIVASRNRFVGAKKSSEHTGRTTSEEEEDTTSGAPQWNIHRKTLMNTILSHRKTTNRPAFLSLVDKTRANREEEDREEEQRRAAEEREEEAFPSYKTFRTGRNADGVLEKRAKMEKAQQTPVVSGGCYCGAVKYRLYNEFPPELQHCYCSWCRQLSGGAFQSWAPVADAEENLVWELEPTHDEDEHALVLDATSKWGARHSCSHCGSTLSIVYEGQENCIWLAAGSFEDDSLPGGNAYSKNRFVTSQLQRVMHICCLSKQPWYALPKDGLPRIRYAG